MTEEIPTEQFIVLDEYNVSTIILNMPFDEEFVVDDSESVDTSTEEGQIFLDNKVPVEEVIEQQDDQAVNCEEIIYNNE